MKSIYDHFTELHLKEFAKDIVKIIKSAQYIGSAPLDITAENYEKKKARGVTGYHYYKVTFRGVNLRINMEVRNGIEEVPYSFNLYIKEKGNL